MWACQQMSWGRRIAGRCLPFGGAKIHQYRCYELCNASRNAETRTLPGQKISLGHHGWAGGRATWLGRSLVSDAEGEATTVVSVSDGTPVLVPFPDADEDEELEAALEIACGKAKTASS